MFSLVEFSVYRKLLYYVKMIQTKYAYGNRQHKLPHTNEGICTRDPCPKLGVRYLWQWLDLAQQTRQLALQFASISIQPGEQKTLYGFQTQEI